MRKLVYLVSGKEVISYEEARSIQPTGTLKTRLDVVVDKSNATADQKAKRRAGIMERRTKKRI